MKEGAIRKTFSFAPDWFRKFREAAERIGLKQSALIRIAVDEYLKKGGKNGL